MMPTHAPLAEAAAEAVPLLALEGVGKAFGRRPALRDVTLALPRGSCLALLGPNGAGKTTLLRIACGLARPTSGRVLFDGSADAVPERLRPRLGYVSHQTLLYDGLSARQNLIFFARLYGVPAPAGRAAELLKRFGLERHADRPAGALSRGLQQRLALARAVVHGPALLLLDEPYASLDLDGVRRLAALLRELKAAGAAILLASHAFDASLEVADAVAVLVGGELRDRRPLAELPPGGAPALYERHAGPAS